MRRRGPFLVATVLTVLLAMGVAPAASQDLPELSPPVIASDNVSLVGQVPDAAVISTAFSSDTPHLYANTLTGVSVYDISDPRRPVLTGTVPMAFFQTRTSTSASAPTARSSSPSASTRSG